MKKVFNGRFINSSLARYKIATCLQILQIKKRLEQLQNKPNESFNCAIIRKVFSTALTIVWIFDHGTYLRGLKWFLTRYVRNVWFSRDLICIRFTKLTLSNLCHLVQRFTKLTNSDRLAWMCQNSKTTKHNDTHETFFSF